MSSEKKQHVRTRGKSNAPKKPRETKTLNRSLKEAKDGVSRRAPSAYGEHMRNWMRQYKSSGYSGSTKEYFAAGARGWKDKKTVAQTLKEVKNTEPSEKKEAEKSTE
jgi:hypothetical protein